MGNNTRRNKELWFVEIDFLDHCTAQGEFKEGTFLCMDCRAQKEETKIPYCKVFGVLKKETKTAYYVSSWITDHDLDDYNTREDIILKACVKRLRKLFLVCEI